MASVSPSASPTSSSPLASPHSRTRCARRWTTARHFRSRRRIPEVSIRRLRSPLATSSSARPRSSKIGVEAARALPGGAAVFTAADLPEIKRSMPAAYGGQYKGRPFTVPVLAHERAIHVGEGLAIVLAETAYQAADGAEAVEVEYEPLPVASDTEAAARLKPAVHDWPDNTTLPVSGSYGDVDKGFAQAEVVVSEKI